MRLKALGDKEKMRTMPKLSSNLLLPRCPHCSVANPMLQQVAQYETRAQDTKNLRKWRSYSCRTCGGVVTASSTNFDQEILQYFPQSAQADDLIPDRPRNYLQQAMESLHAPAGAVMLAASSVDSMLKLKCYTEGTLYQRIDKAVEDHLLTEEMAKWAHKVRLDANDQRHADDEATLPVPEDAMHVIQFVQALGQFLFVLPSQVQRGIEIAGEDQ